MTVAPRRSSLARAWSASLALTGTLACARATTTNTPAMSSTQPSSVAAVPAPAANGPRFCAEQPAGVSDHAMQVYCDAYVIDTHNDLPTRWLEDSYDPFVRHKPGYSGQLGNSDVPRMLASGMTAEFLSVWVDAPYAKTPGASFARAMEMIDSVRTMEARDPAHLLFATTAADVKRAKSERKLALLIGIEGGHAIENSLDRLRDLHARGARYMTLTWNNGNDWAGSSIGEENTRTGGLTPFGKDVVREMNRLGMFVDISHVSDSTFWDVIATTSMPVIASHSSARALNGHPRNLSDEQIIAVGKNGGVVNVNFYSRFIDPVYKAAVEHADAQAGAEADRLRAGGMSAEDAEKRRVQLRDSLRATVSQPPLSVLIDHMVHVAKIAGVDHVGLGSDFDGVSGLPQGMEEVNDLPRIAQALLDRGYSDDDVKKMLGGNMLRVMAQVLDGAPGR